MNKTFTSLFMLVVVVGLYGGVRYIGSAIHYGCDPDPIVNVEGGDDCPPPFRGAGELSWYLTGGSLVPLWNRDATTVRGVSWDIENADSLPNQQNIAADVTTYDGNTKHYDLGMAAGCTGRETHELQNHTIVLGRVECSFAQSSTTFVAFKHGRGFIVEREDETGADGAVATTILVQL